MPRLPISVIVLTYNEEQNIEDCLASVQGWTEGVFVVDSGSEDATQEIAERWGAAVIHHAFESHTSQWSWALENLPLESDWILALDADQRVMPDLRDELTLLFTTAREDLRSVEGVYLKRRTVFRGRWIRHGGYYPKYLLKLFRRDKVSMSVSDLLDHHFYVDGRVLKLANDLIEENYKERELAFFIDKHRSYAEHAAREELIRRTDASAWPIEARLFGTPDQRVVWLKQRWYRLPLYVRPILLFLYRYVVRGGFLDGKETLMFYLIQSFWFRMMADMYLDEMLTADASGDAPDR